MFLKLLKEEESLAKRCKTEDDSGDSKLTSGKKTELNRTSSSYK